MKRIFHSNLEVNFYLLKNKKDCLAYAKQSFCYPKAKVPGSKKNDT